MTKFVTHTLSHSILSKQYEKGDGSKIKKSLSEVIADFDKIVDAQKEKAVVDFFLCVGKG